MAAEGACALNASRVLVCDTDLLLTTLWSDWLFGSCPDWIRAEAARRPYDLHLLLDVDVPWFKDSVRYLPDERRSFHERCVQTLESGGRKYVRIDGSWEQRFQRAVEAVESMMKEERGSDEQLSFCVSRLIPVQSHHPPASGFSSFGMTSSGAVLFTPSSVVASIAISGLGAPANFAAHERGKNGCSICPQ